MVAWIYVVVEIAITIAIFLSIKDLIKEREQVKVSRTVKVARIHIRCSHCEHMTTYIRGDVERNHVTIMVDEQSTVREFQCGNCDHKSFYVVDVQTK